MSKYNFKLITENSDDYKELKFNLLDTKSVSKHNIIVSILSSILLICLILVSFLLAIDLKTNNNFSILKLNLFIFLFIITFIPVFFIILPNIVNILKTIKSDFSDYFYSKKLLSFLDENIKKYGYILDPYDIDTLNRLFILDDLSKYKFYQFLSHDNISKDSFFIEIPKNLKYIINDSDDLNNIDVDNDILNDIKSAKKIIPDFTLEYFDFLYKMKNGAHKNEYDY